MPDLLAWTQPWMWLPSVAFAGFALDLALGDPPYRLHPVRLLTRWSAFVELRLSAGGFTGRGAGIAHWLLVQTMFVAWWLVPRLALERLHPALAWCWDVHWAYSLLGLRGLLDQGRAVALPLAADDIEGARGTLPKLVHRDSATLDAAALRRATIEGLSERLTSDVLMPMWALCLFGVPGLLVVKAASTLAGLVGRRERFGWAAARSDVVFAWLPARAAMWVVAGAAKPLGLEPAGGIEGALRWHGLPSDPIIGWATGAYAGVLKLRLLGPVTVDGALVNAMWIGDPAWPEDPGEAGLERARRLTLVCGLVAAGAGLVLAVVFGWASSG